ncbi:hypothetical protein LZ32DRAFT_183245 [Colletotrichum eremochloae]|nr:hypothetical protein LZ32DRAFT_183245 [Colletotrichum eremochloae]
MCCNQTLVMVGLPRVYEFLKNLPARSSGRITLHSASHTMHNNRPPAFLLHSTHNREHPSSAAPS